MVARFVADWRKTGKATQPNAPQRISPKHAAILVTRSADQITEEQRQLLDRITNQCPEVEDLRRTALAFRAALTSGNSLQLRQWIEGAKRSEFGHVVVLPTASKKTFLPSLRLWTHPGVRAK